MKVINSAQITEEVKRLCIEGNLFLGKDVVDSFKQNLENEESDLGKDVLNILIENAKIACEKFQYAKIQVWQCFLSKLVKM